MRKSIFKSPLLKKYFFSYVALLGIIILLSGLYIYGKSIIQLQSDLEKSNEEQLLQIESTISTNLMEVESIAHRMGIDSKLMPFNVIHNRYTNEISDQLKNYKDSHTWLDEIYVYYGDSTVHSSQGSLAIETLKDISPYFNEMFSSNEVYLDSMSQEQLEVVNYQNRLYGEDNRKIIYTTPLSKGASSPHAYGIYVLDTKETTELLNDFDGRDFIILNERGTPLFQTLLLDSEEMGRLNTTIENDKPLREKIFSPEDYDLTIVSNNRYHWQYISLSERPGYYKLLNDSNQSIFLFLIIIALVGVLSSVILAMYQYRPLNILINHFNDANHKRNATDMLGEMDEYEYLNTIVSDLMDENKMMQTDLYTSKPILRNYTFIRLLEGTINNDELSEIMRKIDGEFFSHSYFVSTIHLPEDNQTDFNGIRKKINKITNDYSDYTTNNYKVNCVHLEYKNQLVFVIGHTGNLHTNSSMKKHKDIIDSIQKDYNEIFENQCYIGVGSDYSEIQKIKQSYLESVTALQYSFQNPFKYPLFFEQLDCLKPNTFSTAYKKKLILLQQSLLDGDKEVAKDAFNDLAGYIIKNQLQPSEAKYIAYAILHVVLEIAIDKQLPGITNKINKSMSAASVEEVLVILEKYILEIAVAMEKDKKTTKTNTADEILEYIDLNYLSNTLSLENIADKYNYSVSYISRLIKEQKGITFNQYVQQLRMNEFKRKLLNTDYPINQLVTDVGYLDVSNFTRKFKKETGMTPSAFRKEKGKDD